MLRHPWLSHAARLPHGTTPAQPAVAMRSCSVAALFVASCVPATAKRDVTAADSLAISLTSTETALLDTLQYRTFRWFWDKTDSSNGLTPDRWPTKSFVSVGAVGFALTAYPIGVERGWVPRAAAAERTRRAALGIWPPPRPNARSRSGLRMKSISTIASPRIVTLTTAKGRPPE